MKKIRCPKCDEKIAFDEQKYAPGRILVFECPACRKRFRLRMPAAPAVSAAPAEGDGVEAAREALCPAEAGCGAPALAQLVVIENVFHEKQRIPLALGDNVIGRSVKGTQAGAAIRTVDPSVDTTHCILRVELAAGGEPVYTLRDAGSSTGTFVRTHLLAPTERAVVREGDIITIGATTLMLSEE